MHTIVLNDYSQLNPTYSICIVDGKLWRDSKKVHHSFRLTDSETGRILDKTIEIHTLELGLYNLSEKDLVNATMLELWLFWLLHAQEYEIDDLLKLFPQEPMKQATRMICQIHDKTEDKSMYDSREKAKLDKLSEFNAAVKSAFSEGRTAGEIIGRTEGEIIGRMEGEIKAIGMLQSILQLPLTPTEELRKMTLEQLQSVTTRLQDQVRSRTSK